MPTPGKPILPAWILWAALALGMLLALIANYRYGCMPDAISEETVRNQYQRRII